MHPPQRRRRAWWVLLALVVADVVLLLGLGGAAGSLAQHERVLEDDTLRACLAAAVGDGPSLDYVIAEPVFDGPNTVTAEVHRRSGTDRLRCTVSAGDEIDDPMVVEHAEVVR